MHINVRKWWLPFRTNQKGTLRNLLDPSPTNHTQIMIKGAASTHALGHYSLESQRNMSFRGCPKS